MPTVADEKKKQRVSAVLACSACGMIFRFDLPYIVDPKRKGPDGGPAVFHADCYEGDETPLVDHYPLATPEKPIGIAYAFVSNYDKVRVYQFTGEFPKELKHPRKQETERRP